MKSSCAGLLVMGVVGVFAPVEGFTINGPIAHTSSSAQHKGCRVHSWTGEGHVSCGGRNAAAATRVVNNNVNTKHQRRTNGMLMMSATATEEKPRVDEISKENPLRVVIAGGGVGGLITARYLQKKGMDVTVYEKTNQFRRFGGPIQLASNALSTIKAIDAELFDLLMEDFTFTGVRTCGIKDGLRTEWYSKFDAIPMMAEYNSLPYTGVVDRPDLQRSLLSLLGDKVVENSKTVSGYKNLEGGGVEVMLEDGSTTMADVLVGADGIWSQVRAQMWNEPLKGGSSTAYSGYTVFAGEAIYEPKDYWDVGYKVYIGPGQYFVTSDVGRGRMQWYAFLALPPGSKARADNIAYLAETFKGWSPEIHEALGATVNEDVEQRDLYDRRPSIFKSWSDGCTTLMGDACHPMMPNLGQGGCQAMEDGFVLTNILDKLTHRSEIPGALGGYYRERILRTATVQGLSRIASDLIITQFDTPAKITMDPFKIDIPGGSRSIMTVLMKPVLPVLFLLQFAFLYSFHPVKMTKDEIEKLVSTERERAHTLAEAAWKEAREDGSFGKGKMRLQKQFS